MQGDPLHNWQKKSKEKQKLFKNYLARANKNTVLKQLPDLHEEAFAKVDCLQCAACCKNYSPRFKTPDVKRISKHLGMKDYEAQAVAVAVRQPRDVVFVIDVSGSMEAMDFTLDGKQVNRLAVVKKVVDEFIVVDTDAVCAAIKDIFDDTRAIAPEVTSTTSSPAA